MDFVVDVKPRLGPGSPAAFLARPGGFFAACFACALSSLSRAVCSFFPARSAFSCAFRNFSLSASEFFSFCLRSVRLSLPEPSGSRPEGSPPPGSSSCRIRSEGRGWSSSCRNFPPFGFGPCWPEVVPFPSGASSSSKRSRREGPEVSGPSRIFGSVWPEVSACGVGRLEGSFRFDFLLMVYAPFPGSRFLSSGRVVIMA